MAMSFFIGQYQLCTPRSEGEGSIEMNATKQPFHMVLFYEGGSNFHVILFIKVVPTFKTANETPVYIGTCEYSSKVLKVLSSTFFRVILFVILYKVAISMTAIEQYL